MTPADTVAVYSFRQLDLGVESARVAAFKATREAIERRALGDLLEGTATWVARDEVEADGTWRRLPTGWGELS